MSMSLPSPIHYNLHVMRSVIHTHMNGLLKAS